MNIEHAETAAIAASVGVTSFLEDMATRTITGVVVGVVTAVVVHLLKRYWKLKGDDEKPDDDA